MYVYYCTYAGATVCAWVCLRAWCVLCALTGTLSLSTFSPNCLISPPRLCEIRWKMLGWCVLCSCIVHTLCLLCCVCYSMHRVALQSGQSPFSYFSISEHAPKCIHFSSIIWSDVHKVSPRLYFFETENKLWQGTSCDKGSLAKSHS